MPEAASCEHCGKPVDVNAPSGLCPACLLRTAIEHGAGKTLAPLLPRLRYFGDYELLEEIARGGMGVVYRARQVSLDRIVAVKMMRPGVLATAEEIGRFQAEARTAAGMQHPNIVAIHEVGEFETLHYFSMDFVEGPNLSELVRQGPLAPREAARYVQVLADAVHYAHGKGVLHRDLKPSNVLVDTAGRPRITDFGLARPIEGSAGLTASGALVGTPAYMPPEQAAGEAAALSPASDCYSLGAILYELLTGRPPFQGPGPVATARMVLEKMPAAPGIDHDLDAICMRCLEKDPARRYQSAADLAADLERYGRGGQPQQHPVRRLWRAAAMVAVILVLVLLWAILQNRPKIEMATPVREPVVPVASKPSPTEPPAPKTAPSKPAPSKPAQPVTPKARKPEGISVAPEHASGARQAFTFRYSQPEGAPPIREVEIEIREVGSERACRIFADPDSDRVSMQADSTKGPGLRISGRMGQLTELANAVCSVDLSGVSYSRGDHTLNVVLPVSVKPEFAGAKEVRSWPIDARTGARLPGTIRGDWTAK